MDGNRLKHLAIAALGLISIFVIAAMTIASAAPARHCVAPSVIAQIAHEHAFHMRRLTRVQIERALSAYNNPSIPIDSGNPRLHLREKNVGDAWLLSAIGNDDAPQFIVFFNHARHCVIGNLLRIWSPEAVIAILGQGI